MPAHAKPNTKLPWIVLVAGLAITAVVVLMPSTPTVEGRQAAAPVAPVPTLPMPIVPPAPTPAQFGAGTYPVGRGPGQMPPGKYHTNGDAPGTWERLDGNTVIAGGTVRGPTTITIKPTDSSVHLTGAVVWEIQKTGPKS